MGIPPFTPRGKPQPQPGPKVVSNASWFKNVQTSPSTGAPIPNLHNCLLALRNDPDWVGQFRYDEMLCAVVFPDQPITDPDTYRILEWMQDNGQPRMTIEPVRQAVEIVGREHAFHPVRDWLVSLQSDSRLLLSSWLTTYLGAPDDEYHRQVGVLFLASMVARIMEPGCKQDHTLVLEGPQRLLKSSVCEVLAGGQRYFSDSIPSIEADKEVAQHLAGKWIIEISELSAFQRADNEKLKAFLTRKVEKYRPVYGRKEVSEPRQCCFIGTTNKKTWSKDETGARRFWPVVCGSIDIDGLQRDRDQLFAEAVEFYQTHRRWWPEPGVEDALFVPQQEARYEEDAWAKAVDSWDQILFASDGVSRVSPPFYLLDIATAALGIKPDHFHVGEQRRLVAVLDRLGWQRAPRTKRGVPWNPV